ncbi:PocR ligand-binding domain-containing protein [Desulfatibacillum aliphaticivorans]|uniref:PocR ligand-binding domain-containing protein n=1 Tax=Desulfatibacillum aliphaticivorans TaxID=218208 RepID=UPI00041721C3|nr:PocR ligand-binding domain-containing protein [Desulfatibacillum aliphaticivorans]
MSEKPTYEELLQRVEELEKEKTRASYWEGEPQPAWIHHVTDLPGLENFSGSSIAHVDLGALINVAEIQSILDDFWRLTNMVTAILDLDGKVIEATGWQDICTKFHRVHPETARNCTESDLFLAKKLRPGDYAEYKCKNGLWDVVTPLYVGSRHLGNIFTGQFFYDDEQVDEDYFIKQAEKYGFDKDEYLKAFHSIPKYSREEVSHLISFLVKFTTYISKISLANLRLESEIQERQKVQKALHESQAMLNSVVRTIPDLVWLKDPDGVFLLCNSKFESLFGVSQKDIVGKTDYDFVDAETADIFREHDQKAVAKGEPSMNEEEVVFADGHKELLETIKTPMYNKEGRLVGVLGIGRDITERRRAELEKARLEEKYHQSQKVESIGRLAGGVAHDLNNLLTPILGYSELLLEDLDLEGPNRQSVNEILQAGIRARDLVCQLLAFSRKQTLEYKAVNLNTMVNGFKSLLRRTIREDIELMIRPSPDICNIMADAGQIEQVLMNLAVNASDAMPRGGILTIETARVYLDENYAKLHEDAKAGDYIMMAVSDNGDGMNQEILQHIFEPFFSTKGQQGTGLGLATVYGIVKQHGGNVWVYSEEGEGTTFKVYLPVKDDACTLEKAAHLKTDAPKGAQRILIVEDNPKVRILAGNILTRLGYTVISAESGGHALEILKEDKTPIDLLLTDVIMPKMNGKELFTRIAEIHPKIKVLYMSGYTGDVIVHHGILDEGVFYLPKPFSVSGLAEKVREALDS